MTTVVITEDSVGENSFIELYSRNAPIPHAQTDSKQSIEELSNMNQTSESVIFTSSTPCNL